MASLTIVVDGAEQKFPLENAAVTLGRGLESDIRLKDIKASRRHCQVVKTPKGYQCVDLSSGNGTYVNGVQIKSQMLGSGDKITIGSTTITFEDAPAPKVAAAKPVSPKAATAKIPVAAPEEKAARTATAKVATAKVQVAPTRKSTARAEPVKAAPAPAGKSGTRISKTSGRTPGPRPARPAAEAPKKKSPVLLIVAAVVLLLAGGAAWFAFGGKSNGDDVRDKIDALMKKAKAAEAAEHVDAAIADYKKAFEMCQGNRYKELASEIRTSLAQLEGRRAGGTGTAPRQDPKETPEKGPDFLAKKAEIAAKFKLAGDGAGADWGGALKEWKEFKGHKPPGDGAAKADEEIRSTLARAREDLARLRKKAEALNQENKMAEALDLLKQQLPRFEHTELKPELDAAIKEFDK